MKKIILILILIIGISAKDMKAQNGVPDTLAYLQSIEVNKANYIGQPFSVLYNNLQIQVKYFSPFSAIHYDKNQETSTSFSFYFPQNGLDDFYLTYPKLEIYWQPYLSAIQSESIWGNSGGQWNTSAYNFYKNAIIADIKVRE